MKITKDELVEQIEELRKENNELREHNGDLRRAYQKLRDDNACLAIALNDERIATQKLKTELNEKDEVFFAIKNQLVHSQNLLELKTNILNRWSEKFRTFVHSNVALTANFLNEFNADANQINAATLGDTDSPPTIPVQVGHIAARHRRQSIRLQPALADVTEDPEPSIASRANETQNSQEESQTQGKVEESVDIQPNPKKKEKSRKRSKLSKERDTDEEPESEKENLIVNSRPQRKARPTVLIEQKLNTKMRRS